MISMSYKELLHPRIQQVLGKVANAPMDPTQSYEVNKLLSAVRTTIEKTRAESTEILKNFVKFENGKPKFNIADGTTQPEVEFIDPFNAEHPDYLSAFEEFEKKVSTIEFRPWSLQMLGQNGVKLSAMEIDLLGPLLTDKPYLSAVEEKYN